MGTTKVSLKILGEYDNSFSEDEILFIEKIVEKSEKQGYKSSKELFKFLGK